MGFPPHSLSAVEQQALIAAEREGRPFLAYHAAGGDLLIVALDFERPTRIGRTADNDVVLDGDGEVSREHARIDPGGGGFTLVDDGMSSNGSYINAHQVLRHQRLHDDDMVRIGNTLILFRNPGVAAAESTIKAVVIPPGAKLTDAERRVLVELCRPLWEAGPVGTPASNQEIADALYASLPTIKSHIRALFTKVGVDDLPQGHKRAELARRAIELSLVTARDR